MVCMHIEMTVGANDILEAIRIYSGAYENLACL